jgi:integral membrane sensor domain MASE1
VRRAVVEALPARRIPGPVLLLGVAAGYLALAQFVLLLNDPVNLGAGFWPAAGLSLALLMLVDFRRWGWVLAGVAIAELGGALAHGYPRDAALWWTAGNCVQPLVGAMLLRRLGNRAGALVPLRQLLRFFGAAVVVGPLVGASIGSIGTAVGIGQLGMWEVWPRYFVGDALGVLVVAPLLLCWRQQRIARSLVETMTLAVATVAVTVVSFHTWGDVWGSALPLIVTPVLMWAALRHGCRGAALAVFATTQIANWFTSTGEGPFASAGATSGHAITLLQIFLVITAVSTFVLAALVEDLVDRTEVEARLRRQASTDELTGLPNRSVLTSALSGRILSPSRSP